MAKQPLPTLFRLLGLSLILVLSLILIRLPAGRTATLTVTSTADGGPGTLRQSIIDASPGDTINFSLPASSTITLTSGELPINKSLTVNGPGANLLTVQRSTAGGTPNFRIFNVTTDGGTVSFSGLTISNGNAVNNALGGGIVIEDAARNGETVNVTNCTLSGNSSPDGGAIFDDTTGTVTINNSIISGNFGTGIGGGVANNNSGVFNIINSTVSGNFSASDGGGILNDSNGTVNVVNSTVSGNSTVEQGFVDFGGGGIQNDGGGIVNVTNSTVSGNTTGGAGGGILNHNGSGVAVSTVNVTNSTISNNTATNGTGGGIANRGTATAYVKSTIIALNTSSSPDVSGTFTSQGYNLIGKMDGSTGFTAATDQTGTIASPLDPKLDPAGLQSNGGPTRTIALQPGSPAIDNGLANGLTYDQRGAGFPRDDNPSIPSGTSGDGTDVGAFEVQTPGFRFGGPFSGGQEVPANNSGGFGQGYVLLNQSQTSGLASLQFAGLSTNEIFAHIHGAAPPGMSAPVLFPLPTTNPVIDFSFSPSQNQVADLKAGLHYMNVHSMNFPGGEIRGQLLWNPLNEEGFFVRQHYVDFLSREADPSGFSYWVQRLDAGPCQSGTQCWHDNTIAVSNAFFFELEFQQTGAYVYRLYRAAYGNTQPFPNPNPDTLPPGVITAAQVPSYAVFKADRAQVAGSMNLDLALQALATAFVGRTEFTNRYPLTLATAGQFVDAVLMTIMNDIGVNLSSQRAALIDQYNTAGGGTAGRGAVMFRLAQDDVVNNPINNRMFIDAEYNRSFVVTEYFGYLQRDGDLGGLNFWFQQVNSAPLRDTTKQHAMVCSFLTALEYQFRFGPNAPRNNRECPQ